MTFRALYELPLTSVLATPVVSLHLERSLALKLPWQLSPPSLSVRCLFLLQDPHSG